MSRQQLLVNLLTYAIGVLILTCLWVFPSHAQPIGSPTETSTSIVTPTPSPTETPVPLLEATVYAVETSVHDLSVHPPKDIFDELNAVAGVTTALTGCLSSILIALIGGIATYIYNERNKSAERTQKEAAQAAQAAQAEREMKVQRVQTILEAMPHLFSGDETKISASLLVIANLGDNRLANDLAKVVRGKGSVDALVNLSLSDDLEIAVRAQESLGVLFEHLKYVVVRVLNVRTNRVLTGFFVNSRGNIVTVKSSDMVADDEFSVTTKDSNIVATRVVKMNSQLGLVLLEPKDTENPKNQYITAVFAQQSYNSAGSDIIAVGYGTTDKVTVTTLQVWGQDATNTVRSTTALPVTQSFEGGVVVNRQEEIVGIVLRVEVATDSDLDTTAILQQGQLVEQFVDNNSNEDA